jgi:hypothetical protein
MLTSPFPWASPVGSPPNPQAPYTALVGQANLQVQLDLPALALMPSAMVQTGRGGTVAGGILATIKHRLERQLVGGLPPLGPPSRVIALIL